MKRLLFSALLVAVSCMSTVLSKNPDTIQVQHALATTKALLQKDRTFTQSELPAVVVKKVQQFLNNNPDLIDAVVVQEAAEPLTEEFRYRDRIKAHREYTKQVLAAKQIDNYANNVNTIVQIPGLDHYFIRISGEAHRDSNVCCTLGNRTNRALDLFVKQQRNELTLEEEQELDAFKKHNPKTLQTISQVAFYTLVQKALALYKIKTIRVPLTALVHVPHRPRALEDKNYVVVQQELQNAHLLWDNPALCKRVTKRQIEDLKKVIRFAGLWDIRTNLFLCEPTAQNPTTQIGLIDFEQPSCSDTDCPPYLNDTRRRQLAQIGLAALKELLGNDHPEAFEDDK